MARVVCVEGRTLMLAGADIVDGSPVLDIKPFVPFCDNVPAAQAPSWVAAQVGRPTRTHLTPLLWHNKARQPGMMLTLHLE